MRILVSLTTVSTIENADSIKQTPATEIIESGKNERAATEGTSQTAVTASPEYPTEACRKKDEFLGFVESGEPFTDAPIEETETAETVATTEPEKIEQRIVQTENEPAAETLKPENQSVVVENSNSENPIVSGEINSPAENPNDTQSEPATATIAAKDSPPATGEVINKAQTTAVGQKEPFEFGKCAVNLTLSLLPSESGTEGRKVIVGAASHNLPPEIDFIEIADGEDLTEIAELVKGKLARFRQTLPVKYIEQLRAAKPKSAKKPATTKTTVAAPTQATVNQAKAEKTNGEQKPEQGNSSNAAKSQSAAGQTDVPASPTAFVPTVNKSIAANEIQGSLF